MPNQDRELVDLFCGAGGFSLGAVRARFRVSVAIDLDHHAAEVHHQNFRHTKHQRRDILKISGDTLATISGHKRFRPLGIIGGPPCQGFSFIGKRRKNDARNKLFYHFFRIVNEMRPIFFVAENVDGILQEKYAYLRYESMAQVGDAYNMLEPFKVCASSYGAATARSRVFFVGVLKSSGVTLTEADFERPASSDTTVRVAFAGLPREISASPGETGTGMKRITRRDTEYLRRINRCPEGVGEPTTLVAFHRSNVVSGLTGTYHSQEVAKRYAALRPGETDPITKSRRLEWDGLCPTLRAGTGADKGSFQAVRPIHPSVGRVITPREAARLQGFPDWFRFTDTKWQSFRQIGNSVSPLMAEGILKVLAKRLNI